MIVLETMYGKKTTQKSYIPEWILNGNKSTQRNFLSGLFGGDGSKIRFNKTKKENYNEYNYTLNTISMSKTEEHIDSLVDFFKNVQHMLEKLDIKTKNIQIKDSNYNKKCVHLSFFNTEENLIKFYETIGYSYDIYKNQESGLIVEFLKYKRNEYSKYEKSISNIHKYIDEGLDNLLSLKIKYINFKKYQILEEVISIIEKTFSKKN